MLAQNFKTADDLQITDIELRSLIGVLGMLERDELIRGEAPLATMERGANEFNMAATLNSECGTIGCIAGWAYHISGKEAFPEIVDDENGWLRDNPKLRSLFGIGRATFTLDRIKPDQAAAALRSYLTTGDARWDLALAS